MRHLIATAVVVLLALQGSPAGSAEDRQGLLIAAPALKGPKLTPSDFSGKTVVVTFFASWCPPCIREFAVLNAVRMAYEPEEVTFIAVNVFEAMGSGNEPLRLKRFLDRSDPGIAVIGGNETIRDAFGGVDRIPTLVVHDGTGAESFRFVHESGARIMSVDEETLSREIDRSLAARPAD